MADNIYINFEEGIKRVINNTKLYANLLNKFKNGTNLKSLDEALSAGDTAKAQASAHTLKGLAANLSLTELHKLSIEIESQIKSGSVDPNQITAIKEAYTQTIIEVDKVISKYG